MYTSSVSGVLISREAIDLAYAVACEIQHKLKQTAIHQAETSEKRVVGATEIEAAARMVTFDLVALIESARAELHAREESGRAA